MLNVTLYLTKGLPSVSNRLILRNITISVHHMDSSPIMCFKGLIFYKDSWLILLSQKELFNAHFRSWTSSFVTGKHQVDHWEIAVKKCKDGWWKERGTHSEDVVFSILCHCCLLQRLLFGRKPLDWCAFFWLGSHVVICDKADFLLMMCKWELLLN